MYATQDLRNEHEGVKIALAVLGRMADDIDSGCDVNIADVEQLMDFLKTFVDRCHHGKEENLLFPALEAAGVPRENGPIGVMLLEHVRGREYIQAMRESIVGVKEHSSADSRKFTEAARGYISLLSSHIMKENDVLFVMAEEQLSADEHQQLAEGFEEIEQQRIGPGVHEQFHAMLDRFSEEYLK